MATSSGTGIRVDYTYDANGMRKTKTVTTGTLASTPRHGLNWDEDGVLRYYENGYRMRVGLIWVDGHYYYIKSDGTAVRNQTYWVSHNNGLMPSQDYTFNEYGWLIDPVADEDFDVAMSTHDKVSETLYFDWVLDANNSTAVTYTYTYNGGSLTQMTGNGQTLTFAYDGSGRPMAVTWNGTTYLYLTNIQGDVIAILDTDGNAVVQYTYDAWGNILTTTGTLADTLGAINPLTYRGYVFDQETGLYYCNARYYSPKWRRFISPDDTAYLDPSSVNGLNQYCYCGNDPVNRIDPSGRLAISLLVGIAVSFAVGFAGSAAFQYIQYGDVNFLQASVDGLFAAASAALAYTGISWIGSVIAGASMGMAQYTIDSAAFRNDFSWSGLVTAGFWGGLGGLASGRGAQHYLAIGSNLDEAGRTGVKAIVTAYNRYGTGAGYQKVLNLWGGRVADSLAKSISQNFSISIPVVWGARALTYVASYYTGMLLSALGWDF